MEILRIVALGLVGAILAVFVRERNKELSIFISLATGILIFLFAISKIGIVLSTLTEMASRANINILYLTTVLKIMGIAYVAEFGAQVCRDAGEGTIASKIEFAAKVLVMVLALPILLAVLESILRLIP